MLLQGKNSWCLGIIFFILLDLAAGSISPEYPSSANYGEVFSVRLQDNNKEAKIEIFGNGKRIARILNNGQWKSTNYYVKNSEIFSLNVTEKYVGEAELIVKTRDSKGRAESFSGYKIRIEEKQEEKEIEEKEPVIKPEIIKLNQAKDIKSTRNSKIYKSKNQLIKELSIYFFALFLLLVLIFTIKHGRKNKSYTDD